MLRSGVLLELPDGRQPLRHQTIIVSRVDDISEPAQSPHAARLQSPERLTVVLVGVVQWVCGVLIVSGLFVVGSVGRSWVSGL